MSVEHDLPLIGTVPVRPGIEEQGAYFRDRGVQDVLRAENELGDARGRVATRDHRPPS